MLISIACSGYKPSPGHPFFAYAARGDFSSPEKQLNERLYPVVVVLEKNCFHPKF